MAAASVTVKGVTDDPPTLGVEFGPMDTNTQQTGAGHQERAEQLAKWLAEFTANPGGLVGTVRTDGYVFSEGWTTKRQAA